MTATLIDGKAIAATLRAEIAVRVKTLPRAPGLSVVLVGDDPASRVYVAAKDRAAKEAGIVAATHRLPADTPPAVLLDLVASLNADPAVDAILVQMPLPPQHDARAVIAAIHPDKDADGFHPLNVGRLAEGTPGPVPCTPAGVIRLLDASGVTIAGARAVVLGRSGIVGKPVAQLLLARDATVTIAHSRTKDLPALCREADILVAAVGRPEMVRADWVRPGAAVIDVGINRVDGALVGDVAFADVSAVAGVLTPVPGGVGPMTIACLLWNTVEAAARSAR